MALPARAPAGVRTIEMVAPDLMRVAADELGDATAWERIADINAFPGVAPDFLLAGAVSLQIPAKSKTTGKLSRVATVESVLFGA